MCFDEYKNIKKVIKSKWTKGILMGMFLGIGTLSAQTILSVQPASISDRNLMPGDTFTVNIYVENVYDLYAYQFSWQYKPALLTVVSITKGPFLSQGGITDLYIFDVDRRCGYLRVGESLRGAYSGVDGSGVLTKILFRVNKKGKTYLDLSYIAYPYVDNMLLNSGLFDIGFISFNGEFSNE